MFIQGTKIVTVYINTNEIPGDLLREKMLSSHVKRSPMLHVWYC